MQIRWPVYFITGGYVLLIMSVNYYLILPYTKELTVIPSLLIQTSSLIGSVIGIVCIMSSVIKYKQQWLVFLQEGLKPSILFYILSGLYVYICVDWLYAGLIEISVPFVTQPVKDTMILLAGLLLYDILIFLGKKIIPTHLFVDGSQ